MGLMVLRKPFATEIDELVSVIVTSTPRLGIRFIAPVPRFRLRALCIPSQMTTFDSSSRRDIYCTPPAAACVLPFENARHRVLCYCTEP